MQVIVTVAALYKHLQSFLKDIFSSKILSTTDGILGAMYLLSSVAEDVRLHPNTIVMN